MAWHFSNSKCTFGVSGFRGSEACRGDCNNTIATSIVRSEMYRCWASKRFSPWTESCLRGVFLFSSNP